MGENSAIEWTDATVNFWWGCTKVGDPCEHCYAETFDKRVGGNHWGLGAPRRKIASAVKLIHKLNNFHAEWAADCAVKVGNAKAFGLPVPLIFTRRRVFIQSMADLFDLEVDLDWFHEAWGHIEACDKLAIQIVTKRSSAIEKRLSAIGKTDWPRHAGLMVSIGDQADADRDIPRLLELKVKYNIPWVGLSIEPLLGPIDLRNHRVCDHCENTPYDLFKNDPLCPHPMPVHNSQQCPLHWWPSDGCDGTLRHKIDWVIVGGESGPKARPMHPDWARSLRDQCAETRTPFLYKQHGEWIEVDGPRCTAIDQSPGHKFWMDPDGTLTPRAEGGLVRSVYGTSLMRRVGKKAAGRLLDGVEHNGMPERIAA